MDITGYAKSMFFLEAKHHMNQFDSCIIMKNNICNAISGLSEYLTNPIVNGAIFFRGQIILNIYFHQRL